MTLNKIQKTDLALVFASIASIATGFLLHAAGHSGNHRIWELWAVAHTLTSGAFLALIITHLKQHKGWLKSFKAKMRIRTLQGRTFVVLSLLSAATAGTGLALLGVISDHSHLGLWHYKVGIIFAVVSIMHIVRRHKAIRIK